MGSIHELVFASGNKGKTREVRSVLATAGITVWDNAELARQRNLAQPPDVDETGSSYRENALLKAEAFLHWSGMASLGDDSGLEVEVLGNAPGLYSARFAGAGATDEANNQKLIHLLEKCEESESLPQRAARYVSYVVLLFPDGQKVESHAYLEGEVITTPRGTGGFGYDPLFVVRGYHQTLAELKESGVLVKTHRIQALEKLLAVIKNQYTSR